MEHVQRCSACSGKGSASSRYSYALTASFPSTTFTSRREHQQLIVARCACTHPGGIALRGFGELPSTRASFFPRTPSLTFCVILDSPCAHRTYLRAVPRYTGHTHVNVGSPSHWHLDHLGYAGYGGFWCLLEEGLMTFDTILDSA